MKTIQLIVLFAVAISLTAITPAVYADDDDMPPNSKYFVLKGGRYSPSQKYDLNNFNGSTASHFDTQRGVNGELALGQYSNPELALELGIGYFESKGSPAPEPGGTRLKAVPIVVTAKPFFPLGPVKPYLEFGIGAYFTKLEAGGNTGGFSSKSKATYGLHAGAGFNIDVSSGIFIGLEGRYLWAKAYYGGQPVKLNGLMTFIDLGFRY